MIEWDILAKKIKIKREAYGKTYEEVAKDLAFNKYKYYRIENNIQEPNFYDLQLILNYYDIKLNIIIHE